MSTELIRVLVVDDSAFMRKALSQEIASDARFAVVGTACDGKEGVEKALDLEPDIITLDVEMPVRDGLDALRELSEKSSAAVIMVSSTTEAGAKTTLEALSLGAIDFIPKRRCAPLLHEKLLAAAAAKRARLGYASHPQAQSGPPEPGAWPRGVMAKAVVIGSSTGGPQALTELFTRLVPPLPAPVFVAQHMPQHFTSVLARRLTAQSGHRVIEAEDGEPVANGFVYIAPGGRQTRVSEGVLSVRPDAGESLYQPSVDILAASVLDAYKGSVLGVMLTGLGRDGACAFTRLRDAGGWTIAQDAQGCTVFGMPKALIDAGGACEVVPLKAIASRISALLSRS